VNRQSAVDRQGLQVIPSAHIPESQVIVAGVGLAQLPAPSQL
jgi:hypothetical protein